MDTRPQIDELLGFFNTVSNIKKQYIERITTGLSMSNEVAVQKLKAGKYILEDVPLSIDENCLKDMAKELETLLKDKDTKETDKNVVSYISWQTSSAFYQKIAEVFKDVDKENWTKPICPVCGSLPKISRLNKEDGKRAIACSLCWTEWYVARIGCVYCGNTSQDMLKYFYADDNKSYRVDVCNKCNKYIKTIDERLLDKNVNLELEDNVTYYMDTLAFKEGYNSPL